MRVRPALLLLLLCTGLTTSVQAQTAEQLVTIVVDPINAIAIPVGTVTISITSIGDAGDAVASASDNSTGYNITSNGTGMKITGALDSDYAAGIALKVQLATPTALGDGASGASVQQTLTTSAQDLITGMSRVTGTNVEIGYTAEVTAEAEPNGGGEERQVTYTLTNS